MLASGLESDDVRIRRRPRQPPELRDDSPDGREAPPAAVPERAGKVAELVVHTDPEHPEVERPRAAVVGHDDGRLRLGEQLEALCLVAEVPRPEPERRERQLDRAHRATAW